MSSPELDRPLRSEAQAVVDLDTRQNINILREAVNAYERQAVISRNGGSEKNADILQERAHAIRWALRERDRLLADNAVLAKALESARDLLAKRGYKDDRGSPVFQTICAVLKAHGPALEGGSET